MTLCTLGTACCLSDGALAVLFRTVSKMDCSMLISSLDLSLVAPLSAF